MRIQYQRIHVRTNFIDMKLILSLDTNEVAISIEATLRKSFININNLTRMPSLLSPPSQANFVYSSKNKRINILYAYNISMVVLLNVLRLQGILPNCLRPVKSKVVIAARTRIKSLGPSYAKKIFIGRYILSTLSTTSAR